MLKNNIEIDVKVKCVEEQITQAELAEKTVTKSQFRGGCTINASKGIWKRT